LAIGAKVVAVEPQPECVQRLKGKFGDRIAIIQAAAGATRSKLPLHVSASMDTVASLSPKFLSHVKDSGRFGDRSWDRTIQVDVLTLDSIISEYGAPVFIKIDVEGFEYSVLGGLSRAVDVVSIEWTADMPEEAIRCIDRFVELGMPWFQFSFGEGMRLAHGKSLDAQQAKALVGMLGEDQFLFGDIYASRRPIFR
jgi:FkbM family methyltransferase